jgi:hypothetical protein
MPFHPQPAGNRRTSRVWFRQLDLAPFDALIWPHLEGM